MSNRMDQFFAVSDTPPIIKVDSVELVREVKKYPIIYNMWLRRDQFTLCSAWELVIAAIVPHYNTMFENNKSIIRKKIRNRWSWMRNTLRRDISRCRIDCHLHLNWFQEMQFLVPLLVNRLETNANTKRQSRKITSDPFSVTSTTASSNAITIDSSPSVSPPLQDIDQNETIVRAFISAFHLDVNASSADPDKEFLFTLLHVYRKMRPDQKVKLRQKFYTYFIH